MNLEPRGLRLLFAIVFLFALGVIFWDVFILGAFLVALFLLTYDTADAIRMSRKEEEVIKLTPDVHRATLVRGDEVAFRANLATNRHVSLGNSETSWLQCEPMNIDAGTVQIVLTASPQFSGRYSTEHIIARARSRYGFFSTQVKPKLSLDVRVYPRFLVTALAVAELLVKSGAAVSGENETQLIGPGLEYAETRPYQPGDSLRRIDWKATARFSSLMVKQFYRDTGGGVNLLYLLDAPGPMTHDEMATEFLNLMLSTSNSGMTVYATAFSENRVVARFSGKGRGALASALSLVLERSGVSLDELYSILDVAPVSQEKRALILAGKENLATLLARASRAMRIENVGTGNPIEELAKDASSTFVILGSLVSRSPFLTEMIDDLNVRRCKVMLGYPRQPWRDALGLEDAYRMKTSQEKILRFAESKSCTPVSLPLHASLLGAFPLSPAQLVDRAN